MKENLVEIVRQYLQIDTNYAIILNGDYGTGKTHFFKNDLADAIKKTSLAKDERKKFAPIHISLFGLKSIEEIQTEIFIELYPILKQRKLKLAAGIGKSIVRGIIGDISEYISDLSSSAETWLNYDELVICFDDLDRKSDSLSLRDVFGFINSIVENQGAKVLIIANENQLLRDENYNSQLREKVIGISLQFTPDVSTVFQQIISAKYSGPFNIYFEYLKENRNRIIEVIQINKSNFRNLIFFLEHFKHIFYSIRTKFSEDKKLRVQESEKFLAVMNFTLAISIEYKLGNINVSNFGEITEFDSSPLANFRLEKFFAAQNQNANQKENEEPKETYLEVFRKKYFEKEKYYFFKSVFEYLIGTAPFYVNTTLEEFNLHFVSEEGKIPECETILNELGYRNCFLLSDQKYRNLTREMLRHADEGSYKLPQYATVFHFAVRFNNMLNFKFEALKTRIKRGANKSLKNHKYQEDLGFYMSIDEKTEFKEDMLEIIKYILEKNKNIKQDDEQSDFSRIVDLFVKDHEKFLHEVQGDGSEYRFQPFWLKIGAKKTHRLILQLKTDEINKLAFFFTRRYRRHIFEKLYPEKEFLVELKDLVNHPTRTRLKKNLKNAALNHLSDGLTEAIGNFP